jgi:putative transposase
LKAEGLVTSPAFIIMKAADAFANPTTAINQLWQTDFTYLKVTGWGWFYLSTVLDDFSRYIVAWKLCTTMSAADVTATLTSPCKPRGSIKPRSIGDQGCYPTMAHPTSRTIWPNGSKPRECGTRAAIPTTP